MSLLRTAQASNLLCDRPRYDGASGPESRCPSTVPRLRTSCPGFQDARIRHPGDVDKNVRGGANAGAHDISLPGKRCHSGFLALESSVACAPADPGPGWRAGAGIILPTRGDVRRSTGGRALRGRVYTPGDSDRPQTSSHATETRHNRHKIVRKGEAG
jgi:hypothetical protein